MAGLLYFDEVDQGRMRKSRLPRFSGDFGLSADSIKMIREKTTATSMEEHMLDQMKDFAREKNVCVLATITGNKPYCSLMAYATDAECTEIYLATHRATKKFRNLTENAAVSLLIDSREKTPRSQAQALTVEGICTQVDPPAERADIRARLLETHPHLKDFLAHPECVLLRVEIRSFLLLKGLTEAYHVKL
jgi:nitroimidazol reductase NimA-like FMN-containing flavoprotein (pyridoxamine 5'-phosphate oxidase superfamily)